VQSRPFYIGVSLPPGFILANQTADVTWGDENFDDNQLGDIVGMHSKFSELKIEEMYGNQYFGQGLDKKKWQSQ